MQNVKCKGGKVRTDIGKVLYYSVLVLSSLDGHFKQEKVLLHIQRLL